MGRKKGSKNKSKEEKIASIGEFAEPKNEDDFVDDEFNDEEINNDPGDFPKNDSGVASINNLDPEELKLKVVSILSEIASKGLTEEEAIAFNLNFSYWNSIAFDILDLGGSLKNTLSNAKLKLTPGKAILLYGAATAGLIALMRPDLVKKVINMSKKGRNNNQSTSSIQSDPPPPPSRPTPVQETSTTINEPTISSEAGNDIDQFNEHPIADNGEEDVEKIKG